MDVSLTNQDFIDQKTNLFSHVFLYDCLCGYLPSAIKNAMSKAKIVTNFSPFFGLKNWDWPWLQILQNPFKRTSARLFWAALINNSGFSSVTPVNLQPSEVCLKLYVKSESISFRASQTKISLLNLGAFALIWISLVNERLWSLKCKILNIVWIIVKILRKPA